MRRLRRAARPGVGRLRRAGAEVPAGLGARAAAAPRRGRAGGADARRDGRGRDVRPRRRRLPPLLGRRALARAALREDALRQRAARPRVPARLARDRQRALPRGRRGDGRVPAPRPAPAGRRLRLLAGRRHRRRRRADLHAGRRARARRRSCSSRSRTAASSCAARSTRRRGRGCSRSARSGRSRGSTTRRSPPGTGSRSRRWPRRGGGSSGRTGSTRRARSASSCSARCRDDGRLVRSLREGKASGPGFLDDYANVAHGLYELHVATGELRWLEESRRLALLAVELFADDERGGFFLAPADGEQLVARRKELYDHPVPSGNSMLAYVLLRLARIYGDDELERRAVGVLRLFGESLGRGPTEFALGAERARPLPLDAAGARDRRPAGERGRARRARAVRAERRRRVRPGRGRAAARGQGARRRQAGGLRLRALRLPGAGHRGSRALDRQPAYDPRVALLSVEHVTRRFGGVVAVDDVTLDVGEGEIVGLIGPNGAGKTTLFNLITRLYKPDEGEIAFDGESLLRTPPHRVVRRGIARTFQNVELFDVDDGARARARRPPRAPRPQRPRAARLRRPLAARAPAGGRALVRDAQAGRARPRARRRPAPAAARRAGRRAQPRGGRRARRADPQPAQATSS